MKRNRWMVLVAIFGSLTLSACQQIRAVEPPEDSSTIKTNKPATVELFKGTALGRVTLTARAAERIGIKTDTVREAPVARSGRETLRKVVPYAAVLYDAHGDTWVYTNPERLVFVRHRITIDYIEGDDAVLSDGPSSGTTVVTVGASLLFGTEFEIGE